MNGFLYVCTSCYTVVLRKSNKDGSLVRFCEACKEIREFEKVKLEGIKGN